MTWEEFEAAAWAAWERIPEEFKEGIDGLRVEKEAELHPEREEVYTLGHCYSEGYLSDYSSPETLRSWVVLYWGSFVGVAERDDEFDWEEEIWETLTHELRHHLEYLAGEEDLEGVDYVMEMDFARSEGEPFDPWYFQQGDEVEPGVFRAEEHLFLEQEWELEEFEAAEWIDFEWEGARYRFPRPGEIGDLHYVTVLGVEGAPRWIEVVLVRKMGVWERIRRSFKGSEPEVWEWEVEVERV